ncbi:MAG: hypothetical protein PHX38_06740 [Sulfuricella sp.]|nr:hypothetical protein [Sulfuricella sp.]
MKSRLFALAALWVMVCCGPVGAQQVPGSDATPPRLSLIEGTASFWRPGAEDWAPARLNTPLAPGDALYAGDRSDFELQIGARTFVRAAERTQLSLVNQGTAFIQLKITDGLASFDLRTLPARYTVELDTPNAVFTIDHTGYYRIEVAGDVTRFITRRGGRATITTTSGSRGILPSEEIVVRGEVAPAIETYVAPEIDSWDRWNYARTEHDAEAMSARYVPAGVYGADTLDDYGNWRQVPVYGAVWVPDRVPPDWVPYSTGSWIWDPLFGWTWIDDAPWGWAPYHYGRWVFINGFWAWAPGPVVVRPVYAPALVAFFSVGRGGVLVGTSAVSWVALGWGEPCIPWWGRPGFVGKPWWGGWGGPRVVNNVVINRTTVVNVNRISFQNTRVRDAVVAVPAERFGRVSTIRHARIPVARPAELAPVRGALPVKPAPVSLVAGGGDAAVRPPAAVLSKPVVAIRPFREHQMPLQVEGVRAKPAIAEPEPRIISVPKRPAQADLPRPPFGQESGPERPRPAPVPRFEEMKPAGTAQGRAQPESRRNEPPRRNEPIQAVPRETAPKPEQPPMRTAPPAAIPPAPPAAAPRMEPERREFREPRRNEAAPVPRETAPRESAMPRLEQPPMRATPPAVMSPAQPAAAPRMEPERREFREPRRNEAAPVPRTASPREESRIREAPAAEPRALPGKPANRMFPHEQEKAEKSR